MRFSDYFPPRRAALIPILISALLPPAAPSSVRGQMRMLSADTPFELSVSQGVEEQQGQVIIVQAAIDYRSLVFLKRDGGFEARYRVYVDLGRAMRGLPRGDVWEETVSVASYKETRSSNLKSTVRRSFQATPGDYSVKVIIEVLDTTRRFERESRIKIVGVGGGKIRLSTPAFHMPANDRPAGKPPAGELAFSICAQPSENGFQALPGGVFLDFRSWMRIYFETISEPGDPRAAGCTISAKITDAGGRTVAYNRQSVALSTSGQSGFCADLNVDHLQVGFYTLSLAAEIPGSGTRTSVQEPFVILLNSSMLKENFSSLLSLLSIVAERDELAGLENAPPEERESMWYAFWKERDPTRTTGVNEGLSEFLRRVRHAVGTFSRKRPGWETDMGRVFIRNGDPDRITDRAGNQFASGSNYQLWYYDSKGLVYIFENTIGGGEYRLVDTQMY